MKISAFVLLVISLFLKWLVFWFLICIFLVCAGYAGKKVRRLLKNSCWAGILVGLILLLGQ